MKHAVLLGDPTFFRIKGGRNPYTRTRWGFRKKVDRARAVDQWKRFRETLERLGAHVFTLPPQKDFPGSVFPANAGFLFPKEEPRPWREKKFYLSRLSAHRSGEAPVYASFIASLGIATDTLPHLFEGEADFFQAGGCYLFTHGRIVPTGTRVAWTWPPVRYQFSHRSDERNLPILQKIAGETPVLSLRLVDTRYYHGDTALFAFGQKREYLLAYLEAFGEGSGKSLSKAFGNRLIALSRQDAERFAANSFQLQTPEGPHLLIPEGLSDGLKQKFSGLGLRHTEIDVSEFFSKGGGSVKCMICDLGPLPDPIS